jgi:type I restriction enzyme S subunit
MGFNEADTRAKLIDPALPPPVEQRRIAAHLEEEMAAVERARAAAEAQLDTARALEPPQRRRAFHGPHTRDWPRRPLGDVGEIVSGVTLGRHVSDLETRRVPYLRVAKVKDGYLDLSEVYEIDATGAELARLGLRSGDLLLTEGGDPDKLGRGTLWRGELPECIHQNHIFRVRLDPNEFLPEFVSAQVSSPYGKRYFLGHAKRTTGIATINQRVLAAFPVMVPPLGDQRRIVAVLDGRMAEAKRVREAAEQQLAAINALPAALLRRAFSGAL